MTSWKKAVSPTRPLSTGRILPKERQGIPGILSKSRGSEKGTLAKVSHLTGLIRLPKYQYASEQPGMLTPRHPPNRVCDVVGLWWGSRNLHLTKFLKDAKAARSQVHTDTTG